MGALSSERAAQDELIGQVVGGYRLERRLGGGRVSRVYLGRHERLCRPAVVKILNPTFALDEQAMSRFFCEARAVAEMQCAHLVDIHDFVFEPRREQVAYVMEYLLGDDLRGLLDRAHVLPAARAARIAAQLCEALTAVHAVGVVHRDIRPHNILLVRRGGDPDFVKLIDFGVAKFPGSVRHHTAAGLALGNPVYMAPEAARGARIDARADIYSLGVLLHEMLTGAPPFVAPTTAATIEQHLHGRVPSSAGDHGAGEVPRKLADVVRRCLAKSPDDRFEDAEQLRGALLETALLDVVGLATLTESRASPGHHLTDRIRRAAKRFPVGFIAGIAFSAGLGLGLILSALL